MADPILEPVPAKPFYYSKTFWLQVLGLVAIVLPQTHDFIMNNLSATGGAWAMINIVLRFISKDKIELV